MEGKWIWRAYPDAPRNFYLYARRTFRCRQKPTACVLRISADSRYKLYVNGHYICRGPARFDHRFMVYDTVDITRRLRAGRNAIGVLVHHYGESTFQYRRSGQAGLFVSGEAELPSGRVLPLNSDSSWLWLPARAFRSSTARTSIQTGFQEWYDARDEEAGWSEPDYDDSGWEPMRQLDSRHTPWGPFEERGIPLLREAEVDAAAVVDQLAGRDNAAYLTEPDLGRAIIYDESGGAATHVASKPSACLRGSGGATVIGPLRPGDNGGLIIDFGTEVAGCPRITLQSRAGGEIVDLAYAETLCDGRVQPISNIRAGSRDSFADRYVTKAGKQTWEPFAFRGFRYLMLRFRHVVHPLRLSRVSLNAVGYPVEEAGSFDCSDELLNRIWETGARTLRLCMFDAYVDCPWREQAQWWGDARVEGLTNFAAFGDAHLFRRGLRQCAQSQTEDGMLFGVFPADDLGMQLPTYALQWAITLWDYFLYTGDREVLVELLPNLRRLLEWCERHAEASGGYLGPVPGRWVFVDWAPIDSGKPNATFNLLYFWALRAAESVASEVGDIELAEAARGRRDALRAVLEKAFWSKRRRRWIETLEPPANKQTDAVSQHANALGILLGLHGGRPAELADTVLLPSAYGKAPGVIHASIFFYAYVLEALFEAGRGDHAMDLMRTKWGGLLERGCTVWPEHWEVQPGWSNCHAWSSSPTYHLTQRVLGVRPVAPGFAAFEFAPRRFDLTRAKGAVPTPHGPIEVSWEHSRGRTFYELSVPEGSEARVAGLAGHEGRRLGPGDHRLVVS